MLFCVSSELGKHMLFGLQPEDSRFVIYQSKLKGMVYGFSLFNFHSDPKKEWCSCQTCSQILCIRMRIDLAVLIERPYFLLSAKHAF